MVRQGRVRERLRETSDARWMGFRPKLIGLDERVEDRDQLSHGGGQSHFLGFPFLQQTLVKGFDSGVESCGHERGHVQHATDIRSAAKRAALAGGLPGIVVQRSHADELRNLAAIEFPQFRQLGQNRAHGHRPDPFDGDQNLDFASIGRVGFHALGQSLVDGFDLLFQGLQRLLDVLYGFPDRTFVVADCFPG